jgi:hypothetical protein
MKTQLPGKYNYGALYEFSNLHCVICYLYLYGIELKLFKT